MSSDDSDANSSLGILDLSDSRLDFSADEKDQECLSLFDKTLQMLQKSGRQTIDTNTSSSDIDLELSNILSDDDTKDVKSDARKDPFTSKSNKTNYRELACSTPKQTKAMIGLPKRNWKANPRSLSEKMDECSKNVGKETKRTLSLEATNAFEDLAPQQNISIGSDMFFSGNSGINLINEGEKAFNEIHRFDISKLSNVSTIHSTFSHVSQMPSDSFFQGRSEKLGNLNSENSGARPSFGMLVRSPQNNASVFQEKNESRQKEDVSEKTSSCNSSGATTQSSSSCTSSVQHKSTSPLMAVPLMNRQVQQPLNVLAPVPNLSTYCCSGVSSHHSPCIHSYNDHSMANFYTQICQSSLHAVPFKGVCGYPMQISPGANSNKLFVPNELMQQIVCLNDNLNVAVPISNLSSENIICKLKILHISVLDTTAVKLDLMANSNFSLPEFIEVKAQVTHSAKIMCCFKVPGKYRVHLEVSTSAGTQNFTHASTAFIVEAEDAKIEMSSSQNGTSCLNFGTIYPDTKILPQSIRIVNNGRATVPVSVVINMISHTSDNFIFPPDLLESQIINSCHTWFDVLPTMIVVNIKAKSSLELPVTLDIGHLLRDSDGHIVASIQLLLKGNSFFRTRRLMKLCAFMAKPQKNPTTKQFVQQRTSPKKCICSGKASYSNEEETEASCVEEQSQHSLHEGGILASSKRAVYFPGVEVGQLTEKSLTLMNKSTLVKVRVQVNLLASSGSSSPFYLKDTTVKSELCKQQIMEFQPKQKNDITVIFKPTRVAPFAGYLQVKVSTSRKQVEKQGFLIPLYAYGGTNQVVMLNPIPDGFRRGYLQITPLKDQINEFSISLENRGSRAAFVAIVPMKDGQIELDTRVNIESKAVVIASGERKEVKIVLTLSRFDEILKFTQSFSIFSGDEQLRQFIKNKSNTYDISDRKLGYGHLKALNIMGSFEGEDMAFKEQLYKEFKNDVVEVFYESVKMFDILLSTDEDIQNEQENSFFSLSNMACSYGSLLNSTLFQPERSLPHFGMSPPIRDDQ